MIGVRIESGVERTKYNKEACRRNWDGDGRASGRGRA